MSQPTFTKNAHQQAKTIQQYYQWQSKIYDLTRWSFLFGRKEITRLLPVDRQAALNILEVGCGTGFNLQRMAKFFPNAKFTGVDVSGDMLTIAKQNNQVNLERMAFVEAPYGPDGVNFPGQMDVILFSYSLTMINPQWSSLLDQAILDLKPDGYIAVVDFHDSQFQWFKNHMGNHHVRMDSHLQTYLEKNYKPTHNQSKKAYLGVWEYLLFVGQAS
ncbi:MAG: class I SAM-dependent methyltransferase [Saprospiraceae bacterium]|nr:class I SAM-dependent methyltransferase [Saprospiraceae bacterium]